MDTCCYYHMKCIIIIVLKTYSLKNYNLPINYPVSFINNHSLELTTAKKIFCKNKKFSLINSSLKYHT